VEALKAEGYLPRRVQLRQCKYLNNVVEQDHRAVKKRVWLAKGYGSFATAWRTLQGIEPVYDSQGQSAVGGEERCDGSSGFYRRAVCHRCLTPSPGKTRFSSLRRLEPIFAKKTIVVVDWRTFSCKLPLSHGLP
jgi:DDE superfamily endonuclease